MSELCSVLLAYKFGNLLVIGLTIKGCILANMHDSKHAQLQRTVVHCKLTDKQVGRRSYFPYFYGSYITLVLVMQITTSYSISSLVV